MVSSVGAQALAKAQKDHVSTSSSAASRGSFSTTSGGSRANVDFGFGISSHVGGGAITALLPAGAGAIGSSVMFELDIEKLNAIQVYIGMIVAGGVGFGFDAMYKRTVAGNETNGLHLGGGLGFMVAGGAFAFNLVPVGGFHFGVPGLTNLRLHLDAGPQLTITTGGVGFAMGALSGILGASAVYML